MHARMAINGAKRPAEMPMYLVPKDVRRRGLWGKKFIPQIQGLQTLAQSENYVLGLAVMFVTMWSRYRRPRVATGHDSSEPPKRTSPFEYRVDVKKHYTDCFHCAFVLIVWLYWLDLLVIYVSKQ